MSDTIAATILRALEEEGSEQGLDVVDVEIAGPKSRPTLRVRLDALEGVVDMDRIADATPWVSDVVDRLDLIAGPFDLEVSSPGLDRPLRRERDFARFAGERAEVRLSVESDGRRSLTGAIVSAADGLVAFEVDGERVEVPLDAIRSARLKPDYAKIMAEAKKAQADSEAE